MKPRIIGWSLVIAAILLPPLVQAAPNLTGLLPVAAVGCGTAPIGTANLPDDPEPTVPAWCLSAPLGSAPQSGGSDGHGGWIDSFSPGVNGSTPAHLGIACPTTAQCSSIENGYTLQDNISAGGTTTSQHFIANDYFEVDLAKQSNFNGADLSPNQTVHFENGKMVLEADVAASEPGFADSNGADEVWPEVVWSTSQALNSDDTNDALYSYGYHKGFWTAGCRIQAHRSLTCAVEADHVLSSTTGDQFPCFSVAPSRVMEISGHQQCGTVHSGFSVDFGAPSNAWRICPAGTVDPCLDRFRFEWSKAGLVAYVNGIKFAEDSGWPAESQLPDSIVDGSTPIFAHYADWGDFSGGVYRFHWRRIAAQPHNPDGSLMGPSASPTFGQTPPSPTPSPSPSATPTASPSPSSSPSPTPSPSPTSTPAPTPFACNLRYGGSGHAGTCVRQSDGSIRFTQP